MMVSRQLFSKTLVAVLFVYIAGQRSHAADESKEPPIRYTLKLNGRSVKLTENEPVRINGKFSNPQLTLTGAATRRFPYHNLSFEYPRHFTFEASVGDAAVSSWTLSGTDFTIMVMSLEGELSARQYAEAMRDEFGTENSRITKHTKTTTLGKHKLQGATVTATLASQHLALDIYRVGDTTGRTTLLIFQDAQPQKGKPSAESRTAIRLFAATFRIVK